MTDNELTSAIDKIGSKLGIKDTPVTNEPINLPANLNGEKIENPEKAKNDDAEAEKIAQQIKAQAEIEENNRVAAEQKKTAEEKKKNEEIKNADVEDLEEEEELEELSDEDRQYIEELQGKKKKDNTQKEEKTEGEEKKPSKKRSAEDDEEVIIYKTKASEYEKILTDPLTKAFLEFRKDGGEDINEFAKKVGLVDIKSFTPEQLREQELRSLGELTDDEIKEAMERFSDLPKEEKLLLTKDIKSRLIKERDEKLTTFSSNVSKQAQEAEAFQRQAITKGVQELDERLSKMEGTKYRGLLVTPEMANEIKQYVTRTPAVKTDEQGNFIGYDIEKSVHNAMYINYGPEMIKVAAKMAKAYAMDKALKLRQRPNKMESVPSQIPTVKKDIRDYAKEAGNDQWSMRSGGKKN